MVTFILVDMNISSSREKKSVHRRIHFCRDKDEYNPKMQLLSPFKAQDKQFFNSLTEGNEIRNSSRVTCTLRSELK